MAIKSSAFGLRFGGGGIGRLELIGCRNDGFGFWLKSESDGELLGY